VFLYNDAGGAVTGPLTPGSAGTLSNSQCTLNGSGTTGSGSGNTLSLTLSLSFTPSFKATQTLFGYALDNGNLNSGWKTLGTFTTDTPSLTFTGSPLALTPGATKNLVLNVSGAPSGGLSVNLNSSDPSKAT